MQDRDEAAAYYRLRARQLREIALTVSNDRDRESLLQCAADYDHLARVQETLAGENGRPS
jgi:hypothetical protein